MQGERPSLGVGAVVEETAACEARDQGIDGGGALGAFGAMGARRTLHLAHEHPAQVLGRGGKAPEIGEGRVLDGLGRRLARAPGFAWRLVHGRHGTPWSHRAPANVRFFFDAPPGAAI